MEKVNYYYLINNKNFVIKYYLLIVVKGDLKYSYVHDKNIIKYCEELYNFNKFMNDSKIYDIYPFNINEFFNLIHIDKNKGTQINSNIYNIFKLLSRAIILPNSNLLNKKKGKYFQLFEIDMVLD